MTAAASGNNRIGALPSRSPMYVPDSSATPPTLNTNRWPSARKCGEWWPYCCGPRVVTGTAEPPEPGTRISGVVVVGANTMTSSAFQVPPLPLLAGASVWGAPPLRFNRFSEPSAKNPIVRLSGDQNGSVAPSVPSSGSAVVVESERNQRRVPFALEAANTICVPSGDRANADGCDVGGVTMSRRVSGGGVSLRWRTAGTASAAAATRTTAVAMIHAVDERRADAGAAAATCGAVSSRGPSNISRASPMSRSRFFGSFSRHRCNSRRTPGGIVAGNAARSGVSRSTDASSSLTSSPANARRPVSIS